MKTVSGIDETSCVENDYSDESLLLPVDDDQG